MPPPAWIFRSWRATATGAFWQGLAFGLVGGALALPFSSPAPWWAFVLPAVFGAAWAVPMRLSVTLDRLVVRNALRRHEVPIAAVCGITSGTTVSGRGRRVTLRTTSSARPRRIDVLTFDDGAAAEAVELMIRDVRARSRTS